MKCYFWSRVIPVVKERSWFKGWNDVNESNWWRSLMKYKWRRRLWRRLWRRSNWRNKWRDSNNRNNNKECCNQWWWFMGIKCMVMQMEQCNSWGIRIKQRLTKLIAMHRRWGRCRNSNVFINGIVLVNVIFETSWMEGMKTAHLTSGRFDGISWITTYRKIKPQRMIWPRIDVNSTNYPYWLNGWFDDIFMENHRIEK